ncbi:ABC transporter permease [Natrarchaeobius sp. A-rgal3]|uniref:ABC transporter permease n=1 Tax=Natrarchaeobius versutus TaxID=1679078 RepID=UPI00350F2925
MGRAWLRQISFVARTELSTGRQSRAVPLWGAAFSLAVVAGVWIAEAPDAAISLGYLVGVDQGVDPVDPTATVIFTLGRLFPLVLTFLAVGCCAGALAGEREAGTIRMLQSLPVSRSAVVCGKLLGRSALVSGIVVVGLAIGAAATWVRFGTISIVPYATFAGVSALFSMVLVTITLAVSAVVSTRLRSIAFSLGPLVLFLVFGSDHGVPVPFRTGLLYQPYQILVADTHDHLFAVPRFEWALAADSDRSLETLETTADLAATAPAYLSELGTVAALLAWAAVCLPIAVLAHRRHDL